MTITLGEGDPPPALSAHGLSLTYPNGAEALREVDFEAPAGRHTAILGVSGSGKSSLLGVLAGAIPPSAGHVERTGRIARIHQDLKLVPQTSLLRTVLQGASARLGFWRSLLPPAGEIARAEDLLSRVGLSHRRDAKVSTLSGGEAQRAAIARALMQDPDILLADEPVASLDPQNAGAVMRLLSDVSRERGLTLVSVLHDHELARSYADEIVTLSVGETGGAAPAAAQSAPRRLMEPPLGVGWMIAAAVLALIVWSWGVLGASPGQAEDAFSTALAFLAQLVPAGSEWADIDWPTLASSLADTIRMSVIGTAASALIALPLAALAARNIAPAFLGAPVRAFLNVWRSVPSIIWALLFVAAVGLGAMAGVLGLIAYSLGYLTKFFYESFEAAEAGPSAALKEMGASGPQRFVQAIWPMSRPVILGHCLFMLEYNVRAASVLGLVGAGGIGHDLKMAADWSNWHVVGVILALFAATVLAMDWLSASLRKKLGA